MTISPYSLMDDLERPDYRALYESIARREPLEVLFASIREWLERAVPGLRAGFLRLEDGRFKVLACGGPEFCRHLDELSDEAGPQQAPWLAHRGQWVNIATHPDWAAQRDAAQAAGFARAFPCDLLTGAGEWLGTLLLLAPENVLPRQCAPVEEQLQALAATGTLAIEHGNLLDELLYQARNDALSGLFNRSWFEQRLESHVARHGSRHGGLIWLDFDGFARVNRLLGFDVGDELLARAGQRLKAAIRHGDFAMRAGADEFACFIAEPAGRDETLALCRRLQTLLGAPYEVNEHQLTLGVSAGIALPSGDCRGGRLLRNARLALVEGRRAGCGGIGVYAAEMEDQPIDRLELEHLLRRALENREFVLHYQPQVRLADGALSGVEALLRWQQASLGLVSPAAFIPIAEEIGLIHEIGSLVLAEACRQARRWARAELPFRLALNVSACQFRNPDFARLAADRLARAACDPAWFELEITESAVLADRQLALDHLHRLRALGMQIALDDFGTGQSSLAYLRELPIQRVKIDRSFMAEIEPGRPPALLSNIVRLAHDLGLQVVAEGVETAAQMNVLRAIGCDEAQGYFIGRPMPAAELDCWRAKL